MGTNQQELNEWLFLLKTIWQHISIVSELSIFQKKLKNVEAAKTILKTIYRIQANSSIMYGYICTGFLDFMLKLKVS